MLCLHNRGSLNDCEAIENKENGSARWISCRGRGIYKNDKLVVYRHIRGTSCLSADGARNLLRRSLERRPGGLWRCSYGVGCELPCRRLAGLSLRDSLCPVGQCRRGF